MSPEKKQKPLLFKVFLPDSFKKIPRIGKMFDLNSNDDPETTKTLEELGFPTTGFEVSLPPLLQAPSLKNLLRSAVSKVRKPSEEHTAEEQILPVDDTAL